MRQSFTVALTAAARGGTYIQCYFSFIFLLYAARPMCALTDVEKLNEIMAILCGGSACAAGCVPSLS